mgnify:FL=1|tara:strand:- start:304 stop:612 length:309 start_codon:yes stop_codon:yes gene_type:complete
MIITFLLAFVSVLLLVSLYYNYRFAKIIMKFEDSITKSLDKLDERYSSISQILEIPIFYDSPQIRKVISDIGDCRDSILEVANSIANVEESQDGEKEKIPED